MIREPFAPRSLAQHVVPNAVTARRRVNDAIVTGVDGDVIDVPPLIAEEEQVTRTQRADPRRDFLTQFGNRVRRARQPDSLFPKHILHEPRRVKANIWISAAGAEWNIHETFRTVENSGSNSRRGLRRLETIHCGLVARHDDPTRPPARHRVSMAREADRETGAILPTAARADRDRAVALEQAPIARLRAHTQPAEEVVMHTGAEAPDRAARVRGVARIAAHTADTDERVRRKTEEEGLCNRERAERRDE